MPLALFVAAAMFALIAIRGNYQQAGTLFNTTFFASGNSSGFIRWFGSLIILAVVFRVIQAPHAGKIFLALLLFVYFLENQGILTALESAIQSTAPTQQPLLPAPAAPATPAAPSQPSAASSAGSSASN